MLRDPALKVATVTAAQDGFVAGVDARIAADAALRLGAGREQLTDEIDPLAGVELLARHGDEVRAGQPIARLYAKTRHERLPEATEIMRGAFSLSSTPPSAARSIIEAVN